MLPAVATDSWGLDRRSISEQAAFVLRDAIRKGELKDPLPGEHELARRLGISRPTVGVALAALAADGLIVIRRGCRSRLAAPPKRQARSLPPTVGVIWPGFPDDPYQREHPLRMELHARFASRGFNWEEVVDPKLFGKQPEAYLRKLVAGRQHVCWILIMAPRQTQLSLANMGVPALVVGTCYPGVDLPSVDFDHEAVGRHAAGFILGHGHTKVGVILPAAPMPGDTAARLGFVRCVQQRANDVALTELSAPTNPVLYRARLDRLLRIPDRPTVLFSMRQPLTLTLIMHLLASGLRIPRDVSIVSRDTHPLFETAIPELTRYSGSTTKLASRIVRIASSLLTGRQVAARPAFVTPTFVAGSTLANLRR